MGYGPKRPGGKLASAGVQSGVVTDKLP